MGKGSRLLAEGRGWDGKAGSHLVYGTGRESTISWRDGTGRGHGTGREQVGESVGYIVGESVGNVVGKSVGNIVGICPGDDSVQNGWEHDRERGLETTVGRGKRHRVLVVNCSNELSQNFQLYSATHHVGVSYICHIVRS